MKRQLTVDHPHVVSLPVVVPGGAVVSGACADAVVRVDQAEHERRRSAGITAVTDLALLDVFLNLPWNTPASQIQLSPYERERLSAVPEDLLTLVDGEFRRLIRPPAAVDRVLLRMRRWRRDCDRAAAFTPFAPTWLIVSTRPRAEQMLEADALGVGVVLVQADVSETLLAPVAPENIRLKPARWRFQEYAYARWIQINAGEPQP